MNDFGILSERLMTIDCKNTKISAVCDFYESSLIVARVKFEPESSSSHESSSSQVKFSFFF